MISHGMLLEPSSVEGTYIVQDTKESESKTENNLESKKDTEQELSEYDKINKPFPTKTKIVENTEQYAAFLGLFKIPRGSRSKRMSKRTILLISHRCFDTTNRANICREVHE